jgi:hypothetical protein
MVSKYAWRQHNEAALLETDRARLPQLIRTAQSMIDARVKELRLDHDASRDERDAISDARAGLNVRRKEVR